MLNPFTAGSSRGDAGSGSIPVKVDVDNHDKVAIYTAGVRVDDPELRAKIEQTLGRKLTPGTSETVAEMQMRIMQVEKLLGES